MKTQPGQFIKGFLVGFIKGFLAMCIVVPFMILLLGILFTVIAIISGNISQYDGRGFQETISFAEIPWLPIILAVLFFALLLPFFIKRTPQFKSRKYMNKLPFLRGGDWGIIYGSFIGFIIVAFSLRFMIRTGDDLIQLVVYLWRLVF